MTRKAALFAGGWEGHRPQAFCDWAVALLEGEGFEVVSHETLAPLADPDSLADIDLFVPIWSSARSSHQAEFGNMTKAEENGMLELIANGCGIAGWHGHMGDAFRDRPTYHFLIGGQFVAHPPAGPTTQLPQTTSSTTTSPSPSPKTPSSPALPASGCFQSSTTCS